MIVAINDLPFKYPMSTLREAIDRLETFLALCKSVEDGHMTNVEKIVIGSEFDYSCCLAPGLVLQQIIQYIQPKDNQRYLMSLLKNRSTVSINEDIVPFCLDGKASKLCSFVKNDIVISLCSSPVFDQAVLSGTCGGSAQFICNLSLDEHVNVHMVKLGIRRYHANSGKHKPFRENKYGKGKIASPMDLDDETAQKLLNKAIQIDHQLYAKKGGKIYTFMKEATCTYHGYINDQAPEHVQRQLEKIPWD